MCELSTKIKKLYTVYLAICVTKVNSTISAYNVPTEKAIISVGDEGNSGTPRKIALKHSNILCFHLLLQNEKFQKLRALRTLICDRTMFWV